MNLRRFRRRSGSLLLAAGAFFGGLGPVGSAVASGDDLAAHLAARYDRVLLAPEDRPLRNPSAVSVDPFGGIFVADTDNHRVLQYDAAGRFTFALGGYGWESGRLSQPTDVCAREGFRVFVADAGNDRVQSFSIRDSAEEGTVFPFSFGSGFGGEPLVRPHRMDLDAEGRVYVSDELCDCVWVFAPTGELAARLGDSGEADGRFDRPSGVAVSEKGRFVYVADAGNRRVQVFDGIGNWRASWGGPDSDRFVEPTGIDLDSQGNVYVADAGGSRIVVLTAEGEELVTFGGPGDGPGRFRAPVDVAVAPDGRVWVVDAERAVVEAWVLERLERTERPE